MSQHISLRLSESIRTSLNMVQLTTEQRTFIIKTFYETNSFQQTRVAFGERFPDRRLPEITTISANVRKFEVHGTSLNQNKGNSRRRRSGRSDINIEAVRQQLLEHPTGTSARRNGWVYHTQHSTELQDWTPSNSSSPVSYACSSSTFATRLCQENAVCPMVH